MTTMEIATKADLEAMEARLAKMIAKMVRTDDRPMNLTEACAYLGGMAKQTLRQKCCAGEIASSKAGGLKFRKADLDAYLDATRRKTAAEVAAAAQKY